MVMSSTMFAIYLILAIISSIPSKSEKLARESDLEQAEIRVYTPETILMDSPPQLDKRSSQVRLTTIKTPMAANTRNAATPRTVAFQALDGNENGNAQQNVSPGVRGLPLRERYGGY